MTMTNGHSDPSEKVGSGARMRQLMLSGVNDTQAILKVIREEFPDSKAQASDVYFNRRKLKARQEQPKVPLDSYGRARRIRALIEQGMGDAEILEAVKKEFPRGGVRDIRRERRSLMLERVDWNDVVHRLPRKVRQAVYSAGLMVMAGR